MKLEEIVIGEIYEVTNRRFRNHLFLVSDVDPENEWPVHGYNLDCPNGRLNGYKPESLEKWRGK